jgi:tetratricopeptide (TPR) repeat protein
MWVARHRIGRGPLAAARIFAIFLLPQILFIDLNQTRDSFVSDSAMYPASAAIIVALVALVAEKLLPRGRDVSVDSPALWVGAACVVIAMGMSFWVSRAYVSAEALWSSAIERSPESVYALNQLGVLQLNQGQSNAALSHFRQALRIDPGDTQSHRNMGAYYESSGEADRAFAEYLVVLNSHPQDIEARCGAARALAAQGDRAGALEQYRRVLLDRPEDERALNDMAAVFVDLGQYDQAIQCFERAIQSAPGDIATRINFANLYLRMGNYDGAIREFGEAKRIDPTNFVIYVNIGSMCGQLSNATNDPIQKSSLIKQSEIEFRTALYWNRDSALAAFNLAKVLANESRLNASDAGKMKEAVFYFNKASALDPENAEYKRYLSDARAQIGNHSP